MITTMILDLKLNYGIAQKNFFKEKYMEFATLIIHANNFFPSPFA
jgi:hypothetical protein